MRIRPALAATLLVAFAAAPALASFNPSPAPPPAPSSPTTTPSGVQAQTPRQEAERLYGDAYNDVRVRAVLDIGGTPAALKWLLFWTEDWGAASRWYSWTLRL